MRHNKFRLITQPGTIIIDHNPQEESDIDQQEESTFSPKCIQVQRFYKKCSGSLLGGINLKGRKPPSRQQILKKEAVIINSDDQNLDENNNDSNSQSLVFVKKVTNNDCLHKKLRRQAMVSNKVKLQRRDQNTKQCSICLTDLKDIDQKQIGRLNCKHFFCFNCILQSSKFSNRCPYCRAGFTTIRHGKRITKVPQARMNEQFDDSLDQPCYICGRNDDFQRLLECQYCQYAYCHTYCDVRLNSDQPPAGNWFCLSCSDMLRNHVNANTGEIQIFQDQP